MGTPSYMAPEQAQGNVHELGPQSDLYSLGAVLYEFITGQPPFQGPTAMDTVMKVTNEEVVAPSRLQPEVPSDLETICVKCLQKEPANRYPNCFELADDLNRFLIGEPILARPVGSIERAVRWCKRNPKWAGMWGSIAAPSSFWRADRPMPRSPSTRQDTKPKRMSGSPRRTKSGPKETKIRRRSSATPPARPTPH